MPDPWAEVWMPLRVVRAALTQGRRAGCGSCWLLAHDVQVICFATLEPTAAKCPNMGHLGDLQRASDCFKNTLFFRKYSVQYSVLCSPPLQPPDSAEAKATLGCSPPQLESRGQLSLTPFPSSQGGRWLSSSCWYPAARCCPPQAPSAAQITVPSSDCGANDGPWRLGTSLGAQGLSCSPTQGFGVAHVIIETRGCPSPETQLRTWGIR